MYYTVRNFTNNDLTYSYTSYDVWHHVGFTFDGTQNPNMRLWIDGVNVASGNLWVTNVSMNGSIFNIGFQDYGGGNYYCFGSIDNVRVYNRALSSAEFLNLYNNKL